MNFVGLDSSDFWGFVGEGLVFLIVVPFLFCCAVVASPFWVLGWLLSKVKE